MAFTEERRGNLESRSRVNFKLAEKLRPSIKKVSEKCQKSLSGGNGSALRAGSSWKEEAFKKKSGLQRDSNP